MINVAEISFVESHDQQVVPPVHCPFRVILSFGSSQHRQVPAPAVSVLLPLPHPSLFIIDDDHDDVVVMSLLTSRLIASHRISRVMIQVAYLTGASRGTAAGGALIAPVAPVAPISPARAHAHAHVPATASTATHRAAAAAATAKVSIFKSAIQPFRVCT